MYTVEPRPHSLVSSLYLGDAQPLLPLLSRLPLCVGSALSCRTAVCGSRVARLGAFLFACIWISLYLFVLSSGWFLVKALVVSGDVCGVWCSGVTDSPAGVVGIGGGLVLGPFLLAEGVPPTVTTSVNTTLILFTSSSASAISIAASAAPWDYSIFLFSICFFATLVGKCVIDRLVRPTLPHHQHPTLSLSLCLCALSSAFPSPVDHEVRRRMSLSFPFLLCSSVIVIGRFFSIFARVLLLLLDRLLLRSGV